MLMALEGHEAPIGIDFLERSLFQSMKSSVVMLAEAATWLLNLNSSLSSSTRTFGDFIDLLMFVQMARDNSKKT